jgi:preprotein translocase subunit Sec63
VVELRLFPESAKQERRKEEAHSQWHQQPVFPATPVKDHYRALGVQRKAGAEEIKSAFRRLAKTCHPDLFPNDPKTEARFKEINEAHEVLSDPDKRGAYDRTLPPE